MADQASEGFLSPFLRKKRFDAATPFLKGKILDFGCGSGGLAQRVPPDRYVGYDPDTQSIRLARWRFPDHRFEVDLKSVDGQFDTIVSLAVIEHVPDPGDFLRLLSGYLSHTANARIAISTPHPSVGWIHDLGASFGLFSKHANEEHHALLNKRQLDRAGSHSGLKLVFYKRFLFGANQLAVFQRQDRHAPHRFNRS